MATVQVRGIDQMPAKTATVAVTDYRILLRPLAAAQLTAVYAKLVRGFVTGPWAKRSRRWRR